MISAQEARDAGPIANYIAVSRELQDQIWKAIYARQTSVNMYTLCSSIGLDYYSLKKQDWFARLESELEALGYSVLGGYVRW